MKQGTHFARARARINVALVKYWGKRDSRLNLPETGSLSVTLSDLGTTTSVRFDASLAEDRFVLDGQEFHGPPRDRVSAFLDLVRDLAGVRERAVVESVNDIPASSGLASSASGFAALVVAATRAAGLDLPPEVLAPLARRGSGSAPRSLLAGFVEIVAGTATDGSDFRVRCVAPPDHLDLVVVVAMTGSAGKAVGSREGMERTRRTSPFHPAWVAQVTTDIERARRALLDRNFEALGRVVETQAFRMHATALASDPPILYWDDCTVRLLGAVRSLREGGVECFPTLDAGPHVFVLCRSGDAERVASALRAIPGVRRVLTTRPGHGAEVLE